MPNLVYLDYNATTPLDPRVLDVMEPWLRNHAAHRDHSLSAINRAREQIATLLNARPEEVCFTTGATEANNLATLGLREFAQRTGLKHIVSTSIEHPSVLAPLERLRRDGFEIDQASVRELGRVDPETIAGLVRPDTLLVSVMHATTKPAYCNRSLKSQNCCRARMHSFTPMRLRPLARKLIS